MAQIVKIGNQANLGSEVSLLRDGAEWASLNKRRGGSVRHIVESGMREAGIRGSGLKSGRASFSRGLGRSACSVLRTLLGDQALTGEQNAPQQAGRRGLTIACNHVRAFVVGEAVSASASLAHFLGVIDAFLALYCVVSHGRWKAVASRRAYIHTALPAALGYVCLGVARSVSVQNEGASSASRRACWGLR